MTCPYCGEPIVPELHECPCAQDTGDGLIYYNGEVIDPLAYPELEEWPEE